MDEEEVTVDIDEKDSLISVAKMLNGMGYNVDKEIPHIRVNDAWISEREALDINKNYHFCKSFTLIITVGLSFYIVTAGTSILEDDHYYFFRDKPSTGGTVPGTSEHNYKVNYFTIALDDDCMEDDFMDDDFDNEYFGAGVSAEGMVPVTTGEYHVLSWFTHHMQ